MFLLLREKWNWISAKAVLLTCICIKIFRIMAQILLSGFLICAKYFSRVVFNVSCFWLNEKTFCLKINNVLNKTILGIFSEGNIFFQAYTKILSNYERSKNLNAMLTLVIFFYDYLLRISYYLYKCQNIFRYVLHYPESLFEKYFNK